ncbi:MAG: SPOR domain-containing protein [Clostridium sp.]|nr:SPOR domain-containing protein [Clostridium sp.]
MKRILIPIAAAALILGAGCKPSEKHYRAAYEAARQKQEETGGIDSTIYSAMRPQGRGSIVIAGADTLTVQTVAIGYPKDSGADASTVLRYNIVVGQFKQIFNARQMRQRLIGAGYEGALVVNTREPLYYVVAVSCATPEEAAAALKRISGDKSLTLREPFPWVLTPAHLRR